MSFSEDFMQNVLPAIVGCSVSGFLVVLLYMLFIRSHVKDMEEGQHRLLTKPLVVAALAGLAAGILGSVYMILTG